LGRAFEQLKGVDTPEMKGGCEQEIQLARKAKQFTVSFLRNSKKIELRNITRDKYFRIDSDVFGDGKYLAQELIKNGLGRKYFGSTKSNWCE
jgi:micrococcal nuclease